MNTGTMLTISAIVAASGLVTVVAAEALSIVQEGKTIDAGVIRHSTRIKDAVSIHS